MEDWNRPINKYTVRLKPSGESLDIDINVPKLRADNLHFQTWGSARILAGQLHTIPIPANSFDGNGIGILELGAGTGLAGLAAAALWRTDLALTDLAPFVPGLQRNIEVNEKMLTQRNVRASCGSLDWNEPRALSLLGHNSDQREVLSSQTDKASVIVVADCLYSEDHPQMLTSVILSWLKPGPKSRLIICYPLRVAYLDIIRDLWHLLEEAGLDSISEGKEEITDEIWDDERLHEWGVWKWRD